MPHNTTAVFVLNRGGSSFSSAARLLHNDAQDLYPRQRYQYTNHLASSSMSTYAKNFYTCDFRRDVEGIENIIQKGKRVRKKMRIVCVCVYICMYVYIEKEQKKIEKERERAIKKERKKEREDTNVLRLVNSVTTRRALTRTQARLHA